MTFVVGDLWTRGAGLWSNAQSSVSNELIRVKGSNADAGICPSEKDTGLRLSMPYYDVLFFMPATA
jgi:hypothetical protein